MQVYDKVIEEVREILKPFPAADLSKTKPQRWKLLKENEFFLRSESAFELGKRDSVSSCYQAVTSSEELVSEDKILLYGPDLQEIRQDVPFTRITFIQKEMDANPDKAYRQIKKLEFARFKIIPEGYMVLSSSMEQKEQVRVSKKAIQMGVDFATIGRILIHKYKKEYGAKHVQVIFITEELPVLGELSRQGKKVDEITNAFDHILKDIVLDCDLCPLHPICDEVEELRKMHFEM